MAENKRLLTFLSVWILALVFEGYSALPGTKLHCTPTSMDLIVNNPTNNTLQLNLINSSCKAVRLNNTHVLFQTLLTDCGTEYKLLAHRVVFFNWLITRNSGHSQTSDGSRVYRRSMPFHCVYKRKDVAEFLTVIKPLKFDERKSSPKEIVSLLGLPVRIQCTLTNGASPITVKFFKNQMMVAKVTGPLLEREILMATKKDFGEYTCIAIDRDGKMASHNITIKQLDKTSIPREGVYTTCSQSSFHVIMNWTLYPWLQPALKHLHLRDHTCEARHINKTHIMLHSPYDQCKTIRKETYGEIIYDNVFVVHVKPRDGVPVLNVPDIEFAIECRLKKIPTSRIVVTPLDRGKLYYFKDELFGIFQHGSTIRAVCETDPYEKFIAWKRILSEKPTPASSTEIPKASNNILLVENITDDDGGIYVCITTRKHLRSQFFVEAYSHAKEKQYIRKGRDGVVVCTAGGFPKVTKTWTKNGIRIEMTGRYSINEKGNLMIAEARKKDGGMYTCEVEQVFEVPLRMRTLQEINIMVEVYEPLVIDRYRTSRKQINTFKGLKTNIICSFKHGATPLSITLTQNGQSIQSNGSVVKVKGRTLYALLETEDSRSFGKYECVAKDAVGKKIQYVMNLRRIGKNEFLKNGITLNCHKDYMDVMFNLFEFPFLDTKNYHIHLNSSNCEPYEFTNSHIRIQAPLTGCGTIVRQHGHVAIYHNSLIAHFSKEKWQNKMITRVPELVFPFSCAYRRRFIKKKTFQVPVESLKVNALRSSPLYVSSLVNIRLRLTCAFTGGVPPLTINMVKDGKRIVEAQKVDEKTLTVVVRARFSSVGTYECNGVDEMGQMATHKITLGLTDWRKIPKTGLVVQCEPNSISIALDRRIYSWIHTEFLSIHLVDQTCKPYFIDSTHVVIETPLNRCGTSYKQTENNVVYRNKLVISERVDAFHVVTWSPVVVFPIECEFGRVAGGGLIPVRHVK